MGQQFCNSHSNSLNTKIFLRTGHNQVWIASRMILHLLLGFILVWIASRMILHLLLGFILYFFQGHGF